jgi:16S rRNA (uracil1498-N3)-methyltransferase
MRVLRLRPGETIELFDGQGLSAPARIHACGRDEVQVMLEADPVLQAAPALRLTLAQALPQGDKMDWILEKAVELGVSEIQPLQARRSVVRLDAARAARRTQHWAQILVAACTQSGQNRLPELAELRGAADWLAQPRPSGAGVLKLMLDPEARQGIEALEQGARPEDIMVAIGPESGWDPTELDAARQAGWTGLRVGPRVLRTETAGLAMIAALQSRWGDWRLR